jgi:hypothetical protein
MRYFHRKASDDGMAIGGALSPSIEHAAFVVSGIASPSDRRPGS